MWQYMPAVLVFSLPPIQYDCLWYICFHLPTRLAIDLAMCCISRDCVVGVSYINAVMVNLKSVGKRIVAPLCGSRDKGLKARGEEGCVSAPIETLHTDY